MNGPDTSEPRTTNATNLTPANATQVTPAHAMEVTSANATNTASADRPAAGAPTIDGKTFAIGILSVTACILFVGFLVVTMLPSPAYGIGQLDRSGDYIMLTQQVSNSTEVLVLIDAAVKRMNVYSLEPSRKEIRLLQANLKLDELPGSVEREAEGRGN